MVTNKNRHECKRYFSELSKIDLITQEEEVKLAEKAKLGDISAKNKLIKANLRFVVSVAVQYQGHGVSLNDLINEGNLGLLEAAEKFDSTRGFKFISYAVWWVKKNMINALREKKIVHIPDNKIEDISKVKNIIGEFFAKNGTEPSIKEISQIANMKEIHVKSALELNVFNVHLEDGVSSESRSTIIDLIKNEDSPQPDSGFEDPIKNEIEKLLSNLTEKETIILKLFFGINLENSLTHKQIGEKFNCSSERIRQIKEEAIRKLRKNKKTKKILEMYGD